MGTPLKGAGVILRILRFFGSSFRIGKITRGRSSHSPAVAWIAVPRWLLRSLEPWTCREWMRRMIRTKMAEIRVKNSPVEVKVVVEIPLEKNGFQWFSYIPTG